MLLKGAVSFKNSKSLKLIFSKNGCDLIYYEPNLFYGSDYKSKLIRDFIFSDIKLG